MAIIRVNAKTQVALKRLSARRGQTPSELLLDVLTQLDGNEKEPKTAYQRLEAFAGIADSGGLQLSTETGRRLREYLAERSGARGSR
jgi:dephospho-CoA kinase